MGATMRVDEVWADGDLIESITYDDDGTATFRRFDGGQVVEERPATADEITALPEPEPDPVVVAAQTIQAEVDTRLAPSSVNSIAEVKTAILDGLAAAVEALRGGA